MNESRTLVQNLVLDILETAAFVTLTLKIQFALFVYVGVSRPTFMPKVITVISILKIKARASCHKAVQRASPAGRSARLLPTPVSDVLVGWKVFVWKVQRRRKINMEIIDKKETKGTAKGHKETSRENKFKNI